MDALVRTRLAGTIAEKWWQEEMAWEQLPISALAHLEIEEDIESVSRRGSFSLTVDYLKVRCPLS
ncbi:unnamed protein product [Nippostrongylus brasiliensis]|uniref:Transcriptional regulator n=1 Tax=Nippostrongylus brasiliensis TaxID=27835 RepID=A0A0N4YYQ0_NIPBR|nr:unnamed protein product [Nippostrongylus brasiliensis]